MSLYDSLGISPTADAAEIKRAHRKAVRKTHPDSGGDPAEFHKVQRAYLVLSDPKARDRYDRTGNDDPAPEGSNAAKAMNLITGKLNVVLQNPEIDPARFDVVANIRSSLHQDRRAAIANKAAIENMVDRLERFRKRLKAKGESNALSPVIDNQILENKRLIGQCEDGVTVADLALEILDGYLYEVDPQTPQEVYMRQMMGQQQRQGGGWFSGSNT